MNISFKKEEIELLFEFIQGGIGSSTDERFTKIMTQIRNKLLQSRVCRKNDNRKNTK
jgi:hypothetical protein